ncbi:DUF6973 domain-containing protein [Corynebacterium minutissimum]
MPLFVFPPPLHPASPNRPKGPEPNSPDLKGDKVVSCGIANQAATTASMEAQNRVPGATSLHNGKGDAFRHCSWNALMTMRIGADAAERIATNHETVAQGPADETRMDLYNNAQSRFLGFAFASSGGLTPGK